MNCDNDNHRTFLSAPDDRRGHLFTSPMSSGHNARSSFPASYNLDGCTSVPDADEYPFEGLPNTRDLGGIHTKDGRRIKPGMLLRSGALDRATSADINTLVSRFGVRTVIDLRETCAPKLRDSVVLANTPVRCAYAGMDGIRARTPKPLQNCGWAFSIEIKRMNLRPRSYQRRMYEAILLDQKNQTSLAFAFRTLLEPHDGAILWHCTIGKDRTGLLTALLMHCLGVDPDTIMKDYLASAHYLTAFGDEDDRVLRAHGMPEFMRKNVHETHMPRVEYLVAAAKAVERTYGSIDAFLSKILGVGEEERHQLQDLYLE